jgi:benzoyl-CoA-dihydrodiol lyase
VRRDHADVFCTIEEGIKGKRAVQWRLIDELISPSKLEARVEAMAAEPAAKSPRKGRLEGVKLLPIDRKLRADGVDYRYVKLDIDTAQRFATIAILAAEGAPPSTADELVKQGSRS